LFRVFGSLNVVCGCVVSVLKIITGRFVAVIGPVAFHT